MSNPFCLIQKDAQYDKFAGVILKILNPVPKLRDRNEGLFSPEGIPQGDLREIRDTRKIGKKRIINYLH